MLVDSGETYNDGQERNGHRAGVTSWKAVKLRCRSVLSKEA